MDFLGSFFRYDFSIEFSLFFLSFSTVALALQISKKELEEIDSSHC